MAFNVPILRISISKTLYETKIQHSMVISTKRVQQYCRYLYDSLPAFVRDDKSGVPIPNPRNEFVPSKLILSFCWIAVVSTVAVCGGRRVAQRRHGDTSARDSQPLDCACTRIPDVSVRPVAIINTTGKNTLHTNYVDSHSQEF